MLKVGRGGDFDVRLRCGLMPFRPRLGPLSLLLLLDLLEAAAQLSARWITLLLGQRHLSLCLLLEERVNQGLFLFGHGLLAMCISSANITTCN